MPNTISDNTTFQNNVSFQKNVYLSGGCVGDAQVTTNPAQRITALKLEHQFPVTKSIADLASAVTAKTEMFYHVYGTTAQIVDVTATIDTVATGSDRTVTIDVQRSTGGGAYATILSTPIVIDHTASPRTAYGGSISLPNLIVGDTLKYICTVAGSAGAQAIGLLLALHIVEDPA